MKNLIQTIRNIFKIEDLRVRILNTLFFLLIYRLGTHIVLPGVDPEQLAALQNQTSGGVLGLLDMFSGGAFSNSSIFALGYHAIHLCIYRDSADEYCSSLFPEIAERR